MGGWEDGGDGGMGGWEGWEGWEDVPGQNVVDKKVFGCLTGVSRILVEAQRLGKICRLKFGVRKS
jgi:hypothetical protein